MNLPLQRNDRSVSVSHESTHWYICFCVLAVAVAVVVLTKVNAPDLLYWSGAIHAFTLIIYFTTILGYSVLLYERAAIKYRM